MKKGIVFSVMAVLVASSVFAFPSAYFPAGETDTVNAALQKAVAAKKQDLRALEKAVLTSSVAAKDEIARMKEPKFNWVFQSLVKVMDAYQALRNVSVSAAQAAAVEVNAPFKTGWGETLTITQLINRESVVLQGSVQDDFNVWAAQLQKDESASLKSPAAQLVLSRLDTARQYIASAKEYNPSFILQTLASVMDEHNALRKINPALAALVSHEINKPIKTGYSKQNLVVSRFVAMESVNVYGSLQYELDAWAQNIERDVK